MKLFLMVGNIGTGKSTTAKRIVDTSTNTIDNYRIKTVSADEIATMLTGGYYGPNIWDSRHMHLYSTIKQCAVENALVHGFDIVVDGAHMNKAMRKPYIDIAKKFNAEVIVYLHTYSKGLQRRIANPRSIHTNATQWTDIHNNFAKIYEEPELNEGITNILLISGTAQHNLKEIYE